MRHLKRIILLTGSLLLLALLGGGLYYLFFIYKPPAIRAADRAAIALMPLPEHLRLKGDPIPLPEQWRLRFSGYRDERLERAAARFAERLSRNTGQAVRLAADGFPLTINCAGGAEAIPREQEDESYILTVKKKGAVLKAASPYGVLRGLETLAQLTLTDERGGYRLQRVSVKDRPRYAWRGLLLDAGRHWMPKEVVLRTLDAMAAAKLNVLHWHLTEYQGFRVESKVFPKLHELGSGGHYYNQDDIRAIVVYAADRGIRIVPEFDLPGHSTSWFVGYPELASAPGPYQLDTRFGVLTPVMDPTREEVYDFLNRFFGEMAALFPDPYFHIGGDEVEDHDWQNNPAIQAFMRQNNLADSHALQAYFNRRLETILQGHGKKMAGWDEILHPALGDGIVVQSWRSQRYLFEAVGKGARAILSAGYYLDHKRAAADHYRVDPEVLPGAVDVEPDSAHWQVWQLRIDALGSVIEPRLVLFGEAPQQRGFLDLMGNMNGIPEASRQGDELTFSFQSDYGTISFRGTLTGDSLSGTMGLGVIKMPAAGRQIGGPGFAGSAIPQYERINPLTEEEKERILGGEACMWSEVVDARTVESRIWPRAAAVADKLWSPAALTTDVDDMYRRLDIFDDWLSRQGSRHRVYRAELLPELGGSTDSKAMATFVEALEEVKYYDRLGIYGDTLTVHTPLNRLVDAVAPESRSGRYFTAAVDAFLAGENSKAQEEAIMIQLEEWRQACEAIAAMKPASDRQEEVKAVAVRFLEAVRSGTDACISFIKGEELDPLQRSRMLALVDEATRPQGGVLIAPAPAIRRLVEGRRE